MIYMSPSPNTNSPSDGGPWETATVIRLAISFDRPFRPSRLLICSRKLGPGESTYTTIDLVPIDDTSTERDAIIRNFKKACRESTIAISAEAGLIPAFVNASFTASSDSGASRCTTRTPHLLCFRHWPRALAQADCLLPRVSRGSFSPIVCPASRSPKSAPPRVVLG